MVFQQPGFVIFISNKICLNWLAGVSGPILRCKCDSGKPLLGDRAEVKKLYQLHLQYMMWDKQAKVKGYFESTKWSIFGRYSHSEAVGLMFPLSLESSVESPQLNSMQKPCLLLSHRKSFLIIGAPGTLPWNVNNTISKFRSYLSLLASLRKLFKMMIEFQGFSFNAYDRVKIFWCTQCSTTS